MVNYIVDKVLDDVFVLRLNDDETKYFEAIWSIPEGVTYNSYVLLTKNGAVVFDTWKHNYKDLFIEALRKVVDLSDIKYLVIHHMEPDHSGSLPLLVNTINGITVLGHAMSLNMIKSFYGVTPKFKIVKDNERIKIGDKTLRFIHTPWLHWPETIMTYIENYSILLTCDAFGGFSIPTDLFDDREEVVSKYLPYVKKYIVTIVGHYKQFIIKNIQKINNLKLPIKIIAPAHGLIWRTQPDKIINYYINIAEGKSLNDKIVIIYGSMYGYVERAINIAIDEINKLGFKAKVFKFTDSIKDDIGNIIQEIIDAKLIILGAATYESDIFPDMKFLLELIQKKASYRKPVIIISIYGWGPVAGRKIIDILSKANYEIIKLIELRGLATFEDEIKIREVIKTTLGK